MLYTSHVPQETCKVPLEPGKPSKISLTAYAQQHSPNAANVITKAAGSVNHHSLGWGAPPIWLEFSRPWAEWRDLCSGGPARYPFIICKLAQAVRATVWLHHL